MSENIVEKAALWDRVIEMWHGMGSPEVFFAYVESVQNTHKTTLAESVNRIYEVWVNKEKPVEICDYSEGVDSDAVDVCRAFVDAWETNFSVRTYIKAYEKAKRIIKDA